ncbi:signal transduction histidine kinase [Actinokineospora baliensis]|uniref:sensor histidine kinase n=1 Tax=Actinokineospora baliensis TaxID=547056 RepID=UPI00195DA1B7|nr:sensor histidine kinase [Actinokineospora baliensis]MBM7774961.1 signal transduction histidine kinase [Actinokineospora baliensis]
MTSVDDQLGLRREQRWDLVWVLAPYGLLVLACGASAVFDHVGWQHRLVTLGIAAVLGGWHALFIAAHDRLGERRWAMAVYFAGLLALTAVLVLRSDAFQLFVPGCYLLAFVALPGWPAYLGVVAANVPWLLAQGGDTRATLLSLAMVTPLVALTGGMIRAMEREAVRRRETNRELVAMAEENARLHALLVRQARETGIAEERARLAREIHDTVAQGLTGIVTQLEAVDDRVPLPVRGRLVVARDLARSSLTEVRRSIEALRPGPLQDARLGDAIRDTVGAWQEQYDIAAAFTVTGTPLPVHSEVEVTVLRAAQEALSNVGRHAAATRVDVTLSYMEDVIILDVRDDGIGFDVAASGGFGLTALRQRVRALSGSVDIESAPGGGTAVSVTVPVIEAEQ